METLTGFLSAVDKKVPVLWVLLVLVAFVAIRQNNMAKDISHIQSDMARAQINLNNHITDTNKKIERLSDRFDKLSDRFDKLSDRFDRLSDRFGLQDGKFVQFYELLLKDKKGK